MLKEFGYKATALLLTLTIAVSTFLCVPLFSFAEQPTQASFKNEYIELNQPLEVNYTAPAGTAVTYRWYVADKSVATTKTPSLNVSSSYKGKMIRCEVWKKKVRLSSCEIFYSELPVVYLNTQSGNPIDSKEEYVNANVRIAGNSKYNSTNTTLYDGACTAKGHGNSTWAHFDKKAYKLKLDKKTDLFGMGKNKSWLLIANYLDASNMRNKLSTYYGELLGTTAMNSRWVDLVINGQYMGLYELFEQVKIAKDRVNIFDWEDAAGDIAENIVKEQGLTESDEDALKSALEQNLGWMTSGKVTYAGKEYAVKDYYKKLPASTNGGFLIEMDNYFDEISRFKTNRDVPLMVKSPEYLNTNETVFAELRTYLQELEDCFYAPDKTIRKDGKVLSYTDYCDFQSLLTFWLSSEFMRNEIGFNSTYMHKDTDKPLVFGPIWDFDFSADSVVPFGGSSPVTWATKNRAWFSAVMQSPYFAVKARELYYEKEPELAAVLANGGLLETWHDYIQNAALRNESKWKCSRTFEEDYAKLRAYLQARLNWIDNQFQSDDTALASLGGSVSGNISLLPSGENIAQLDKKAFVQKAAENFTLHIATQNTASTCVALYINSKYIGDYTLNEGQADITVDASLLTEAAGTKNVMSVWSKDAAGNFSEQQYCTVTVSDKEVYTLRLSDGERVSEQSFVSGERIRLPKPDAPTALFSAWKAGETSLAGGSYITPQADVALSAVYTPCTGGNTHNFTVTKDNCVCTICGKSKEDTAQYTDVRDVFVTTEPKYKNSYTGEPIRPTILLTYGEKVLQEGKDYSISYKNNINVGFATYKIEGIKSAGYCGTMELIFGIVPVNIGYKDVQYQYTNAPFYYTGKPIQPKLKITYLGKTLAEGKDYRLEYENNVKVGSRTGIVKVYGLGNFAKYSTPKTFRFTIAKSNIGILKPKLTFTAKPYTGKAFKPGVVFSTGAKLRAGIDYTVKYENNKNIGRARVTIYGKGNYTGKAVRYFTIGPKATAITSLTSPAKNTIRVSYKRPATSLTGYQIIYSDRKDFKKFVTVTVRGYYNTAKVIKMARHYPVLYVKVRAYKTIKGIPCFNSCSPVKTIKVKAK